MERAERADNLGESGDFGFTTLDTRTSFPHYWKGTQGYTVRESILTSKVLNHLCDKRIQSTQKDSQTLKEHTCPNTT